MWRADFQYLLLSVHFYTNAKMTESLLICPACKGIIENLRFIAFGRQEQSGSSGVNVALPVRMAGQFFSFG